MISEIFFATKSPQYDLAACSDDSTETYGAGKRHQKFILFYQSPASGLQSLRLGEMKLIKPNLPGGGRLMIVRLQIFNNRENIFTFFLIPDPRPKTSNLLNMENVN